MTRHSLEQLRAKQCTACEGSGQPLSVDESREQLKSLPGWKMVDEGRRICKDWQMKSFSAAMDFLNRVAQLAEQEGHHPDLHLTGYRHVSIVLSTHAIGGLSENDFILAAKIDDLPVKLKS